MNVLIVYWHPEPKSFNGAMVEQGVKALESAGHSVQVSDLHNMNFDPVSGRNNFKTVSNESYFNSSLKNFTQLTTTALPMILKLK
ncbi:NAD(P)H oxidoreductase YRKL [Vibrio astriarenae]|nr:NAD(P)H oxidoreductase YRKL [Vibrio sp. C7]